MSWQAAVVRVAPVLRGVRARAARLVALAVVLGVAAVVVPDSSVQPTEIELVKLRTAEGIDIGKDTVWILGVGSDARPGQSMTRSRGDAIQLIGINTRTGAASTIGIPRDSWVPIAGYGYNRVNAALYFGGPSLMARAVGDLVGVRPQYVFVTRFPYFEDMIDSIGGIHVRNPRFFSDSDLKPKGFKAGRIHLNGYSAMAFSRIRKTLPGGDFDRTANQQRTLRGIQARIAQRAGEPAFIERGVMTAMAKMDTNVGPAELYELAQVVAQIDPRKMSTCVVSGSIANIGGASVVRPNVTQARRFGKDARTDATIKGC